MRRIQSPTAVPQNPGTPTLSGTSGFFTSGNPAAGLPATIVPDWWLNMVQEELAAIVTGAGQPLDGTSGRVLLALNAIFARRDDFTNVQGQNGYMRTPAGIIIQWGVGTTVTGGGDAVVFPVAFPSTCRVVTVTERVAAGWYAGGGYSPTFYGANGISRTGFGVYAARIPNGGGAASPAVGCDFNYIAVGV